MTQPYTLGYYLCLDSLFDTLVLIQHHRTFPWHHLMMPHYRSGPHHDTFESPVQHIGISLGPTSVPITPFRIIVVHVGIIPITSIT